MIQRSSVVDNLLAVWYHELRASAQQHLSRERKGHTLSATALVHEVYIRLKKSEARLRDETHFESLASRLIRQILIDHARRRTRAKRGGVAKSTSLEEMTQEVPVEMPHDMLAGLENLDEALRELAAVDERQSRVVELRFFGGLNIDQTAALLGCSAKTVTRDWATARVWLRQRMERQGHLLHLS